jgi:hypothetical protein
MVISPFPAEARCSPRFVDPTRSSGPGQPRKTNQRQAKLPLVLEEADGKPRNVGDRAFLLLENVARSSGSNKRVVVRLQQEPLGHCIVGGDGDSSHVSRMIAVPLLQRQAWITGG